MNDFYVLVDHNQKMIIDHIKRLPENWNNINGLNLLDPEKLYNLDWAGQIGLGWVSIEDNILDNYTFLPEWFNISKSGLQKQITDIRWEKEHAVVTFNGNSLKLDDRTRLSLNLQKTVTTTNQIKWKFIEGFVVLTAEEFSQMYNLVMNYIQSCFNEESRLIDLYDTAETIKDLLELEIITNWPSTILV